MFSDPRRLLICGCLCPAFVAAAQAQDARAAVSVSLRHGTLTIAATGRSGEVIAVRPVGLYYKVISDKSTPVAGTGCISVDQRVSQCAGYTLRVRYLGGSGSDV